jgi:hypothetical protein
LTIYTFKTVRIFRLAVCLSGIAAEFEAKVLVEALKQVREAIGITKEKEVFKPEYLKRNKQD